jgi:uncharacterized protein YjbI with pentapeptide repeats
MDLTDVDFNYSELVAFNFSESNLTKATLWCAYLEGANFSGANLSWTCLMYAHLQGANFTKANLKGANLSDANLTDADLSQANLGIGLNRKEDTNFNGADLTNAKIDKSHRQYLSAGQQAQATFV